MRLSATQLNDFCLLGMIILLRQWSLSLSDMDRIAWELAFACVILVGLYVRFKPIGPGVTRDEPLDAPESP